MSLTPSVPVLLQSSFHKATIIKFLKHKYQGTHDSLQIWFLNLISSHGYTSYLIFNPLVKMTFFLLPQKSKVVFSSKAFSICLFVIFGFCLFSDSEVSQMITYLIILLHFSAVSNTTFSGCSS